jgi:hypothetical protein
MSQHKPNPLVFRIYLLSALLGCLLSLVLLFQNPSESQSAVLFGLSKVRLILAFGLLLWGAGLVFILRKAKTDQSLSERTAQRLGKLFENGFLYALALIVSLIIFLTTSQLWRLSHISPDPYVQGYLGRLEPVLVLLGLLGLQNVILLPFIRYGQINNNLPQKLPRVTLYCFAGILLFAGLIAFTGIGVEPDLIGWDPPGVPLLAAQVWLIWGLGFIFVGLESMYFHRRSMLIDLLVSLAIWGTAAFLWGGQPLSVDYFALEPKAPNFEFYPYSDAATHDVLAQRLLIGEGYPGIARKPLYAAFLALLHAIAGQDYNDVVMLQVMVIAFLPVGLYWLTKSLHLRSSGVIAALFIILRERNALVLSGTLGVSHVKLLMSDLPATLGMVLLVLAILAWLRAPAWRRIFPLISGGVLGLLLLVRPQIAVFVPVALIGIMVLFFKRPRIGALNFALFSLGLGLSLVPWLWRSFQISGQFALNDPAQNAFLTQQYSRTPGQGRLRPLSGESQGEFAQRVDEYLSDFILANPGYVASFVSSHFAHHLVEMVIALPMSPWIVQDASSDLFPYWRHQEARLWESCCSLKAYVHTQPFWDQRFGEMSADAVVSLLINLAVLAIGLAVVLTNNGLIGWVPLGVGLVYVFSTSLGRYSGWRLLLPADWVLFLYFSIGLGQMAQWLLGFYAGRSMTAVDEAPRETIWQRMAVLSPGAIRDYRSGIAFGIGILSLGLSPLLIERFVPQKYEPLTREDVAIYIDDLPGLEQFLDAENSVLLHGRVLYPRFYKADQGEPGGDWPAFSPRPYSRLGFVVIGPRDAHVVLPTDASPKFFPHASDVIVFGCPADEHIQAKLVVLIAEDGYTLVPSSDVELSCDHR